MAKIEDGEIPEAQIESPPDDPAAEQRKRLESECIVSTFVAGGPGGQHRNRTETGVRLLHKPTGIRVSATERRSQHQNKDMAFERLEEKLKERSHKPKKRVKTRVSRGQKKARMEAKRIRARAKARRKPPDSEGE